MTTDSNVDDYKPELDTSEHELIATLVELKAKGNGAALVLLRENFTPEHIEANAVWVKSTSDAKRRREEHERDEADRRAHESSLRGASRIAEILRRSAGV